MKMSIFIITFIFCASASFSQDFEYCNNFLMNYSFITFTDRGVEQNLEDNLSWMEEQGYTHLRFFGIYPNGVHIFPSATLDSNGYPNSSYHEPVLEQLVNKAVNHGIVVNFDGWEIIAESNYDTTNLGVSYITPEELSLIIQDVLDLGVTLISEEQFGLDYLLEFQSNASAYGATHETTACLWYQTDLTTSIADMQLSSVFNFFPLDQIEADSLIAAGSGCDIAATLGVFHLFTETPRYFNIPTSIAVGSFGTLDPENWKNVLLFSQVQHQPDRMSIEEQDNGFLISDTTFNFMEYVGNELAVLSDQAIGDRPIVNLVYDLNWIYSESFIPSWYTSLVNAPAIVNTFTQSGYKVIATVDSLLPEADIYYFILAGGIDAVNVASLPDYVLPVLDGEATVFIHPATGIPDENDADDWLPLRDHFGLPPGETQTLINAIPEIVTFRGFPTNWSGIELYTSQSVELIPSNQIDTSVAEVVLSGEVSSQETALVIKNNNSYLINSNVIHLEASYILSNLIDGPSNRPSGSDIVIADGKGLIFAEYDTEVEIDIPWNGLTHIVRYNPSGQIILETDIALDGNYYTSLQRGELVILTGDTTACCIGIRGNIDHDPEESINISDLVFLVDYMFNSGPVPYCDEEIDVNASSDIDIADLIYMVSYMFDDPSGPAPVSCY